MFCIKRRKDYTSVFQVRDGQRTLEFEGRLLAESTSQKRGGTRWVEFKLYKTKGGSYILNRVGCSLVFHHQDCALVRQYNLKPGPVPAGGVPCQECYPSREEPEYFPEKTRNWAQVMEKPEAVLEALYKYDEQGAKYMTLVAQRLLDDASAADDGISSVYRTEYVQ